MNGNLVVLGIVLLITGAVLYFYYAPFLFHIELVSEVKNQQIYGLSGALLPEGTNTTVAYSGQLTLIAFNTSSPIKVVYPKPLYSTSEKILGKDSEVIVESGKGEVVFVNNASGPVSVSYLARSIPTPSVAYYTVSELLFAFGAISIVVGYLAKPSKKGRKSR